MAAAKTPVTNAEVQEAIHKHAAVFEAVLLGMHQDLQSQQGQVDRKLADAASTLSDATAQVEVTGRILRALSDSVQSTSRDTQSLLESLREDIGAELAGVQQLQETLRQTVEKAGQSSADAQRSAAEELSAALSAVRDTMDRRLQSTGAVLLRHHQQARDLVASVSSELRSLAAEARQSHEAHSKGLEALILRAQSQLDARLDTLEKSQALAEERMRALHRRTVWAVMCALALAVGSLALLWSAR